MTKAEAFRQLVETEQRQPVSIKVRLMEVLLFGFTLAGRCGISCCRKKDFLIL